MVNVELYETFAIRFSHSVTHIYQLINLFLIYQGELLPGHLHTCT